MDFYDDFENTAFGPLDNRVSPTGHVWDDFNDGLRLDGEGGVERVVPKSAGGGYGQINLSANITKMSAEISFMDVGSAESENSSLVFIYSWADVHGGTSPSRRIFDDAVHIVYSTYATEITFYTADTLQPGVTRFSYPRIPMDGTVFPIDMERRGDTLHFLLPNGKVAMMSDSRIQSYAGPYLIYQCYDTNGPNILSRFESVSADSNSLPPYAPPIQIPSVLGTELV